MNNEKIVFEDPKSPISEAFRSLRTNIQFLSNKKKGLIKTILVTSVFMSEGKSWTAANLAIAFAQAGNKVLLIDSDMRKGRQHHIFEVDTAPGLSNYLSQISESGKKREIKLIECLRKTCVENVILMPLGSMPENPSELILGNRMKALLGELSDTIDIIIVDAPPSTMITDSIILSRLVDGVLIVTEYDKTKADNLKRITKDIKNVGGNILGVVINKIPVSKKKYQKEYYYYGEEHLNVVE